MSGRALVACVLALSGGIATAEDNALGQFDRHSDVGSPKIPGAASYDPESQEYALTAAGVNMWGQRDEFHFAWKRMKGDFILQARV